MCGEPAVGSHRLAVEPGDVERHRALDEVPRVAVAAGEPGDHPVRVLQGGDLVGGGIELGGRQHVGEIDCHCATPYSTRLLPRTGDSTRSATRVERGC